MKSPKTIEEWQKFNMALDSIKGMVEALTPEQVTKWFTWVEALWSGSYEQTQEVLFDGNKSYCCLGVFGCLEGYSLMSKNPYDDFDTKGLLNDKDASALGLQDQTDFSLLNDEFNLSFIEIGTLIYSFLEKKHGRGDIHVPTELRYG